MNLPLKKRSLSISLTLIGWGSWMLLESGGGWKSFLKVLDKLGKVTKFGTSRPLFHGEMDGWKKYELIQPPPRLIGLKKHTWLLNVPVHRRWQCKRWAMSLFWGTVSRMTNWSSLEKPVISLTRRNLGSRFTFISCIFINRS